MADNITTAVTSGTFNWGWASLVGAGITVAMAIVGAAASACACRGKCNRARKNLEILHLICDITELVCPKTNNPDNDYDLNSLKSNLKEAQSIVENMNCSIWFPKASNNEKLVQSFKKSGIHYAMSAVATLLNNKAVNYYNQNNQNNQNNQEKIDEIKSFIGKSKIELAPDECKEGNLCVFFQGSIQYLQEMGNDVTQISSTMKSLENLIYGKPKDVPISP